MPLLSRWLIRLSIVNAWVGLSIASLMLAYKGRPEIFSPDVWRWVLAHVDLLLIGWMVQLSIGVAYWIMPRLAFTISKRGRPSFAVAAGVLLNSGVWLYSGNIIFMRNLITLQTIGLSLQLLGITAFAIHVYPRIRPAVSHR